MWKAWEGLEEGAKLGELVVRTVKRKKPDGSIVEEQTMQVKPGVSPGPFRSLRQDRKISSRQ